MKMSEASLCANCTCMTERIVETYGELYDYKRNGKQYDREFVCSKGHEIYAHQITVKCTGHEPKQKVNKHE